jgi:hypothetical protein
MKLFDLLDEMLIATTSAAGAGSEPAAEPDAESMAMPATDDNVEEDFPAVVVDGRTSPVSLVDQHFCLDILVQTKCTCRKTW